MQQDLHRIPQSETLAAFTPKTVSISSSRLSDTHVRHVTSRHVTARRSLSQFPTYTGKDTDSGKPLRETTGAACSDTAGPTNDESLHHRPRIGDDMVTRDGNLQYRR